MNKKLIFCLLWSAVMILLPGNVKAGRQYPAPDSPLSQKLEMPAVFGDGMVLQRDQPVQIWGTCRAGSRLRISFNGKIFQTRCNADGNWRLKLPQMPAGGPYLLEVGDEEGDNLCFNQVMLGDVWLCAGQSNLNFMLSGEQHGAQEISNLNNPMIRMYRADMPPGVINPENTGHSKWIPAVSEGAAKFSAVGYYFAKQVAQTTGVAIGILVMACGDTRAESWMPREAFAKPEALRALNAFLDEHHSDQSIPYNHRPGEFYNLVVREYVPFNIRGLIWYQGESNALPDRSGRPLLQRAKEYKALLKSLISYWRSDRGEPRLPFYLVQLPGYKDQTTELNWAVIRQAQLELSRELKHCGLAVTIDSGDQDNLHPPNKQLVGERLAFLALSRDYKISGLSDCGPMIRSVRVRGRNAILDFYHQGNGLLSKSGVRLTGFSIADQSAPGVFVAANAEISGRQLVISALGVSSPAAVRYGWADNPVACLFNEQNLPASPFEISVPK